MHFCPFLVIRSDGLGLWTLPFVHLLAKRRESSDSNSAQVLFEPIVGPSLLKLLGERLPLHKVHLNRRVDPLDLVLPLLEVPLGFLVSVFKDNGYVVQTLEMFLLLVVLD